MANLKVLVLVKQTFNTEARIQLTGDGAIDDKGIKLIMNPYDEYAVEEAVRMKEKGVAAQVRMLTVGPDACVEALRQGLAMGADSATRVWDASLAGIDNVSMANVLAAAIKKYEYNLILAGKVAVDDQAFEVPGRLAVLLDLPIINAAVKIEATDGAVTITRETDAGTETLEAKLPAIVTTEKGLNEPRLPPLPKIMKAKKMPIDELKLADLGGDLLKKTINITGHDLPPARTGAKIVKGKPAEAAVELVRLLKEEAKVL
jgi:electron transfer flavoprotein beta subunit